MYECPAFAALHFLKEIKSKDKHAILNKVKGFKPFVPHVADKLFESRFEQIRVKAYGKSG